jgi:hypothetical protein
VKAAVLCNGPSRVAYKGRLGYDYVIGCNIPWTDVDGTVILDSNVIHAWSENPSLIKCSEDQIFITKKAWMTADELKFRDFITNRFSIQLIDKDFNIPEMYSAGHVAASIALNLYVDQIDIYGCDSYYEQTVESFTSSYINDVNKDSEQQRIDNWRKHWIKIQDKYSEVIFNFVKV